MTAMHRLKRIFVSRRTITALVVSALAAVTVGGFIPQSFIANQADLDHWRMAHPLLESAASPLGLHHIYTTPLFALVLTGVVISLAISCRDQFRSSKRQMSSCTIPVARDGSFSSALPAAAVLKRLRGRGFFPIGRGERAFRMVRHPWGYWGNFLLHLGMLVTILASLVLVLTQQRAMLQLSSGESFRPGQPWRLAEKGILAAELKLDETLRLDGVHYSFWPSFGVRELASDLAFIAPDGRETAGSARVNEILSHRGLRVYQGAEFGHAFKLEVVGPDGAAAVRLLEMARPVKPDQPSYQDLPDVLGQGVLVRAKYLVNDGMKSFEPLDPTLWLRIDRDGKELGRVALKKGGEGNIGPYRFRLLDYTAWSQLILVRLTGMEAIFAGFLLMCLGGILHYFLPPREVVVAEHAEGTCTVSWRALRFAGFYREEYQALKEDLTGHGELDIDSGRLEAFTTRWN